MTSRDGLLSIDVAGATLTLALLGVGAWSTVALVPAASGQARAAKQDREDLAVELRSARTAERAHRAELEATEREIKEHGALPEQSPVEADLRMLTDLCRSARVDLVDVTPAGSTAYPGLTELKYTVRAQGDFVRLTAFFRAFTAASFWADITELNMVTDADRGVPTQARHRAEFTISLFATEVADADAAGA